MSTAVVAQSGWLSWGERSLTGRPTRRRSHTPHWRDLLRWAVEWPRYSDFVRYSVRVSLGPLSWDVRLA